MGQDRSRKAAETAAFQLLKSGMKYSRTSRAEFYPVSASKALALPNY